MQFIKGFRKNYFSLVAMTVFSSAKKLGDCYFQSKTLHSCQNLYEKEDEESPPDLLAQTTSLCKLNAKPCYCNKIFALKTHIAIHLHIFIPRCPYYNKYFAFRRSGSHPPKTLFI